MQPASSAEPPTIPFDRDVLAAAVYLRAQAYVAAKLNALAKKNFDDAIVLRPDFAMALLARAQLQVVLSNWDGAIQDFLAAIRLRPEMEKEAATGLGTAYSHRGKKLYQSNRYNEAIADLTEARRLHPPLPDDFLKTLAYAFNDRGVDHDKKGAKAQAIVDYTAAIEVWPEYSLAVANRGWVHWFESRYDPALKDAEEAIRIDGKDTERFRLRSLCHMSLGNLTEAMSDVEEALRRQPRDWKLLNTRGQIQHKLGKLDLAIVDFNEAILIDATAPYQRYNRAMVHKDRKEFRAALRDLNVAIKLNATFPDYFRHRGSVHSSLHMYARAEADYLEWCKMRPNDAAPYNSLAWLWAACPRAAIRNGRKAVRAARKACRLSNWKEAFMLDTLAAAYAECRNFKEAVKWQAKAVIAVRQAVKAEYEARLQQYREGKPCRDLDAN